MKIVLRQEEYDFLISALGVADKRSYDPVYKNVRQRIEVSAFKDGIDRVVVLEESEVFSVLEALSEYIEESENGKYNAEEKKNRTSNAKNMTAILNKATGISI